MGNNVSDCSCEHQLRDIVNKLECQSAEKVIYQTSLMSALLHGVYDGSTTVEELLTKGDFGLGTFNRLDGELVALDRQVYQLRSDGSARFARPEQKSPFAVMTFFKPEHEYHFSQKASRDDVHNLIDSVITSDNHFCALRISGGFASVQTRTVPCQCRPYRSMPEVLSNQPTFDFSKRAGEMIGFRTPQYMQGINVAGYHEHFITDDRHGGGHILDYVLEQGILTFGAISKLVIDLPHDRDFLQADLQPENLDEAIRSVES
ncbi:acetolactate decarboxylase [Pantoea sp. At-9b]|jgi:acetolactate decarboxylase|uniref:acetolactate decarboxylase n=1 Tax=Pantoea sp. (strain At-9b) TaxID=592316 RepID=UPI0001B4010B|nr:acetolactate decarboxylase [Pantoea sp. At-9b]ADU72148.1 alpha-acetolactate decarboxylase [Pantoea sp. At-9b]